MSRNERLYVVLPCGHAVGVDHLARRLELLGLMPCSSCVDACEDRARWLDERADDDERRQGASSPATSLA